METQTLEKVETSVKTGELYKLVLHNDDYNNLGWVMNCLMDICKHNQEQAEQSALITHNNGQCTIKLGNENILKEMQTQLLLRELSVTIETNE